MVTKKLLPLLRSSDCIVYLISHKQNVLKHKQRRTLKIFESIFSKSFIYTKMTTFAVGKIINMRKNFHRPQQCKLF